MSDSFPTLFAGLSQVRYSGEPFDLGYGIILRPTYAHLLGVHMMAFKKPERGKHHPPSWRAARGGFGYDIEAEIAVPTAQQLPGNLSCEDSVWLIAALLRLVRYAYLMIPVMSDHPFNEAGTAEGEPVLRPFEIEPRILAPEDKLEATFTIGDLEWVRSIWSRTAKLLADAPELNLVLRAADQCTVRGKPASAVLTAWGALEQLFAPARTELRFRVSAHIAAFLETPGPERLKLFKHVSKLYDARSKAAHSAQEADVETLMGSFVILRNALIRVIDNGTVPSQSDLENMLFGVGTP